MHALKAMPLSLLCSAVLLATGAGAQTRIEADFAERWVGHDEALRLRAEGGTVPSSAALRAFIGTRDVSALLRWAAPGEYRLLPTGAGWPAGERVLVLYDADWTELARWPLKVRTRRGFEDSQTTLRLDTTADGRADESRSDGQPLSPRGRAAELSSQGGVAWQGRRGPWQFEAGANLVGYSVREKALRFNELAGRAPRVDLADYRLALARGDQRLELGHLNAGTHALLAQGVSSRGLGLSGRLGERSDVSLHVVGGSPMVGWDDPLGLSDDTHRMQLLSLGTELLASRPGALRAELSVLDASVAPQAGFNIGEVPDAERSRGLGLRLLGQTEGGRLRGELAFARSRFVNPFDPQLALDGELQAVRPDTRNAWSAELQAVLLQQAALAGHFLDLTLSLRHDHAEPLYRSLAAFVTSDLARTRLGLQASLAGASAQLQLSDQVDNLDRVPTLLRTRTQSLDAALNLPLGQWLGAADGHPLWPSLGWNAQLVHQRADNTPLAEDSGFAASQRPDQRNTAQQLSLNWALPQGSFSYGLSRTLQDNRQPGRELADFRQLAHQAQLAWRFGEALGLSLGLTRSRQHAVETGLTSWTTGGNLALDWQLNTHWALSGSVSTNDATNSLANASNRNTALQAQLSRRFQVRGVDRPLPGQVFVRWAQQRDRQRDTVFDQHLRLRSTWVDVGLSISFF